MAYQIYVHWNLDINLIIIYIAMSICQVKRLCKAYLSPLQGSEKCIDSCSPVHLMMNAMSHTPLSL